MCQTVWRRSPRWILWSLGIIGVNESHWTEWLTWIVQVVWISTDLNCHLVLVGKLVNQHFSLYEIDILLGKWLNYSYTKQILFCRKVSHFCPYPQLQGDVILHRQVPGNGWAQIVAFAGYYELFVYKFNGTPGATERYVLSGFDHEYCHMCGQAVSFLWIFLHADENTRSEAMTEGGRIMQSGFIPFDKKWGLKLKDDEFCTWSPFGNLTSRSHTVKPCDLVRRNWSADPRL